MSFSSALSLRMTSNICRAISGARPSEGSSSSSSRGRLIKRARDRQHLLLAARQRAAALVDALLEAAEIARRRVPDRRSKCAARQIAAPICRFSSTVMRRKMRRPSGACAILQPRDLVGRQRGDVAAGKDDRALARARIAENRHHQRRFAGAVGADQRDDLAFADVDVDALAARRCCRNRFHAARRREAASVRSCPTSASTFSTSSSSTPR